MKKFKEYITIYTIGAAGYGVLEIIWRGFTHWTMAVTGGLCFIMLYISNLKNQTKTMFKKCVIGSLIITSIEFLAGVIINLKLKWNVWDYSHKKYNIKGQVCLFYTILWFLLCIPLTLLCKKLRKSLK